jgi:hypothetical protein
MKNCIHKLLSLLHLLVFSVLISIPVLAFTQFPTAVGTKWEYFQFFEDVQHPWAVIPSFEDEVVGDTVADGNTYHIVRRIGHMYNGFGTASSYDTLDGTWYYRVLGTQVWVLDSVSQGTAHESLLYEFGLSIGDTLSGRVKNLINLTPKGNQAFHMVQYNWDTVNANSGGVDSIFVLDTAYAWTNVLVGSHTWSSHGNIFFLPGIGTIWSGPYMIVLDVYGQYYFLKELTSNGQRLYRNELIASAVQEGSQNDFGVIHPNPAQDRIRISSTLPLEDVQIMDIIGNVVVQWTFSQPGLEQELELKDLPRGLYWVRMQTGENCVSKPLLLR